MDFAGGRGLLIEPNIAGPTRAVMRQPRRVPGTTRSKDCPHVRGRQQATETRQMSDEPQGDDISTRAYEAMRRLVVMLTRSKARNAPAFIVSHRYLMRRIAERDRRLEVATRTRKT